MAFWRNSNKRTVRNRPVWYVLIDESGKPVYDDGDPFIVGALVTDDPERLAYVALSEWSNTKHKKNAIPPGMGELKHSRSNREVSRSVLAKINGLKVQKYAVMKKLDDPELNDDSNSTWEYLDSFKRIMDGIAQYGPDGIYKVRIDHSYNYDTDIYKKIAQESLKGTGKDLSFGNPVMSEDSELVPSIQAADMFVGELAWQTRHGKGREFADDNLVIQCNKRGKKAAGTGRHRIQNRR